MDKTKNQFGSNSSMQNDKATNKYDEKKEIYKNSNIINNSNNIHYLFSDKNDSNLTEQKNTEQENNIITNSKNFITKIEKSQFSLDSKSFQIDNFIKSHQPQIPVYALHQDFLKKSTSYFISNFKSFNHKTNILYSVKSNPDQQILKNLFDNGILNFDVASLPEVKLINDLFGKKAKMFFMHPIKSRLAIREAYFTFGIRDFSLDSFEELQKILEETNNAKDLSLHLRLAIPNNHSAIDLSRKFGILPDKAISLLRKIRIVAKRAGICFHVGSQCMEPLQYRTAIEIANELLKKSKVNIDILDIGGGFPTTYPAMTPPKLSNYFSEIFDAINQIKLPSHCEIWCEPGRALVADAISLIVKVEARKGQMLYLNDGTYGGLFDAGVPAFIYHSKAIAAGNRNLSNNNIPFGFYGPTCDSLDVMKGPFYLPENIAEGDYIQIGQMGAYSRSIRTAFNGFDDNLQIIVDDQPIISIYNQENNEEISGDKINEGK